MSASWARPHPAKIARSRDSGDHRDRSLRAELAVPVPPHASLSTGAATLPRRHPSTLARSQAAGVAVIASLRTRISPCGIVAPTRLPQVRPARAASGAVPSVAATRRGSDVAPDPRTRVRARRGRGVTPVRSGRWTAAWPVRSCSPPPGPCWCWRSSPGACWRRTSACRWRRSPAIIGVVLAGIALGSWLGGRLADRIDPEVLLPARWRWAARPPSPPSRSSGRSVRRPCRPTRRRSSSSPPPASSSRRRCSARRHRSSSRSSSARWPSTGRIVGRLSALGTAGSLVGVFLTGFVFVAEFPITPVVIALGLVLVAVGAGLWFHLGRRQPGRAVAAGVILGVVASGVAVAAPPPCDVETAYYCASVLRDVDRPSGRLLRARRPPPRLRRSRRPDVPRVHATPSCSATSSTAPGRRAEPIDAVHLGGGGFTIPRYLAATRPGSDSLVLELDPGVVDAGRGRARTGAVRPAAGDHRRRPGQPARRPRRQRRPRRRRRLRRPGRAVAPDHDRVRPGHPAGAARRRDLRPERDRPATARLPPRRRGHAARRCSPTSPCSDRRAGSTASGGGNTIVLASDAPIPRRRRSSSATRRVATTTSSSTTRRRSTTSSATRPSSPTNTPRSTNCSRDRSRSSSAASRTATSTVKSAAGSFAGSLGNVSRVKSYPNCCAVGPEVRRRPPTRAELDDAHRTAARNIMLVIPAPWMAISSRVRRNSSIWSRNGQPAVSTVS